MVRVRVKGSVFGWDGVRQPGETLDVPEEVAEKFPRSLEVIESGYETDDSDENPVADSEGETESGYDTCLGNDGECSRNTPDGEDYCWQHS